MSVKTIGVSALFRILAAGAVFGLAGVAAVPAMANTAVIDQAHVTQLTADIVSAVKTAQLSADCQNKKNRKAQIACAAAVQLAIETAIANSGASPFEARAALTRAQTQLVAEGVLSNAARVALASVSRAVNQQIAAMSNVGAGSGPRTTNSISAPPSGSGGGGYIPTDGGSVTVPLN